MTNAMQLARANKILDKKLRYDGIVMTRKEFLQQAKNLGYKTELSERNRIDFNRIKFNRMSSYKEQEEYERKTEEKVPDYRVFMVRP